MSRFPSSPIYSVKILRSTALVCTCKYLYCLKKALAACHYCLIWGNQYTAQPNISSYYLKRATLPKHAVLGNEVTHQLLPGVTETAPVQLDTEHMVGGVTLKVSPTD